MGHPLSPICLFLCVAVLQQAVAAMGFLSSWYVDDAGTGGRTPSEAWGAFLTCVTLARFAGFRISIRKIQLPAYHLEHLGLRISTLPHVQATLPAGKAARFAELLRAALNSARKGYSSPTQMLQCILGKCMAYGGLSRGSMARTAAAVVALRASQQGQRHPLRPAHIAKALGEFASWLESFRTDERQRSSYKSGTSTQAVATSTLKAGSEPSIVVPRKVHIIGSSDASITTSAATWTSSSSYAILAPLPEETWAASVQTGSNRSSASRETLTAASGILIAAHRSQAPQNSVIVWYVDNTATLT